MDNLGLIGIAVALGAVALVGLCVLLRRTSKRYRERAIILPMEYGDLVFLLEPLQVALKRALLEIPELERICFEILPDQKNRRIVVKAAVFLDMDPSVAARAVIHRISAHIAGTVEKMLGLETLTAIKIRVRGVRVDPQGAIELLRARALRPAGPEPTEEPEAEMPVEEPAVEAEVPVDAAAPVVPIVEAPAHRDAASPLSTIHHPLSQGPAILEMRDITKRFPGVLALDRAKLHLRAGEVHCLVGENGAGKSTMMKILAGAQPMDSGEILLEGETIQIHSPHHAQQLGISMIYQEFNLSPYLSVAENIFLGREPRLGGSPFIDWQRMYREAREILGRIRVDLDVKRPVNELSVAQQQMVEIAKALSVNAKIIVMDEPSATLTEHELEALFDLVRTLRAQGIGLIYISHRLEEIFYVGDRVTVMRDGEHIATNLVSDVDREDIIRMMVGRELKDEYPKEFFPLGRVRLQVDSLSRDGVFRDVSFTLRQGEIVGLTGLVGAGRTEVARTIFGADRKSSGILRLDGEVVDIRSPQDAIRHGIGLLTEDRKNQGLVLGMTVRENTTLSNLGSLVWGPFVRRRRERAVAEQYVRELQIKTPSIEQVAQNLSGGNQQKLVLAKWLFTQSKVLIFDEPTRGIDVGAKAEIFKLMNALVEQGVAMLVISSELPEVLGMCDRILVMHEGRLAGQLMHEEATQEGIMRLATGEALERAGLLGQDAQATAR